MGFEMAAVENLFSFTYELCQLSEKYACKFIIWIINEDPLHCSSLSVIF